MTSAVTAPLPRLTVAPGGRTLATEAGPPFFWLADTAWELFHRLTREEAAVYLANRAAKGFTVVQAVALAEFDGLNTPNAYGHRPLIENDPARPDEAYFAYVDELIRLAAAHGLYVALLPTWGDKVTQLWGAGPQVFTEANAHAYGAWLARRYRDQRNLIWVLGGDRPAVTADADARPIWRAMARGIREQLGALALITFHPQGGFSSSQWLHAEPWLDLNMLQSGHGHGPDAPTWELIARDYARNPAKPTLDGEPNYEDHPVAPWPTWDPARGYYRDYDVRKQCYRSVFAGGCGVTYGHHAIWQFYGPGHDPVNHVDRTWQEALDRPGAAQLRHLRALIESRPCLTRAPDQSIITGDPGKGAEHRRATRDDGTYALVYLPTPSPVTIRMDCIAAPEARAWWFDPRTGDAREIGVFPAAGTRTFTPQRNGPDWVLALDDPARGYAPPGAQPIAR